MAVNWPSTLPVPTVSGYSNQPGDGRVITKMSQGPSVVRKMYDNVPNEIAVSFVVTIEQLKIFNDFWKVDMNGGVEHLNIQLVDGGELTQKTVQVFSRGKETPVSSNVWRIGLLLETV